MVRQILKPRTGGLTQLIVPNPNNNDQWDTINDRATMEMMLLQRSQTHFQQADGTPYTIEPIRSLLGPDGLTQFGKQIYDRLPIDQSIPITPGTRLLLEHQYNKVPKLRNVEHPLEFESLMKGFRKWPERTATSPSGRHLGVYKSLLRDQHHEKQGEPITTKGVDIMMEIYRLLVLSVKHTHTFERWKTVWNLYLEKDPGRPRIDRLRTLHIVEADYNLLLKWHSSLGFMARAEAEHSLSDCQSGGRAGRSAIDLACQKISLFEIYRMIRRIAIEISNDAANCFDRMVEICQNLSCRQHGADPQYLKLHAQMQQLLQYFVKHAYGVSDDYNQHSGEHPWYGAGQGTADAAPRWIVQADSMFSAYHSKATQYNISNPDQTVNHQQGMDAFMDDTWMSNTCYSADELEELMRTSQQNLSLWNEILQASGGLLNPKKCVWMMYYWKFSPSGKATLTEPPQPIQLTITEDGKEPQPLKRLQPHEAHRYLGVQLTADGNHKEELKLFQKRTDQYVNLLKQCPLNRREARVVYLQCYLPTLSYPLPATSIPPNKLYQIQSKATAAFLSRMGYPRTFPRAVVYATIQQGGIGFRHLGHEQGVQQMLQILKHLRAGTTTGTIYTIMIQHYQLISGFSISVLERTTAIPWSTAPWMDSLRGYLQHVKGQIIMKNPWTLRPRRQHDVAIMEDIWELHFSKAKAIQINSVRTYLKITFLSEITDHSGTTLLPQALEPQPPNNTFFHRTPNQSTLSWPTQPCPGKIAWRQWKEAILWMYAKPNSTTLLKPLGHWTQHFDQDFDWTWTVNPRTHQLFHRYNDGWHTYQPERRRLTEIIYPSQPPMLRVALVDTVPVPPQLRRNRIHLALPITPITPTPAASVIPQQTLLQKLTAPPDTWEGPLWAQITPTEPIGQLKMSISKKATIMVVSDASVSPHGYGTCAWTIWAQTILWKGIGYVPGPSLDMYSGLAEAYGMYAALSFLQRYIATFPLVLPHQLTVQVYCDNKGLID